MQCYVTSCQNQLLLKCMDFKVW